MTETEQQYGLARNSRVVWITGAAGVLGSALTQAFLATGDRVVALWHQKPVQLTHPRLHSVQLDLSLTTEVNLRALAQSLPASWRAVDVLILNAGINQDHLLVQTPVEEWDLVQQVNLRSAFQLVRSLAPELCSSGSGHLIAVSSFAARRGHAGQAAYVSAKAALISLIQSVAREWGGSGVCANAVMPGVLHSPMTEALEPHRLEALREENVLKRLNDPAEVAAFVQFLSRMRQVSGQVFQLDSRIAPWT